MKYAFFQFLHTIWAPCLRGLQREVKTVSESSTGSSTFSIDQDLQTKFDFQEGQSVEETPETTIKNGLHELPKVDRVPPEKLSSAQVYVKELEVQGIEKRIESKAKHEPKKRDEYEYVLQVCWSDDTFKTLHRSYEEMFDFQCKLRKMYPNKVDENGHPWKLPFLPGRIRLFHRPEQKGERTPIPDITDYARLFGTLPKFVRGCDHVVKFFQCSETPGTKRNVKKNKGTFKRVEPSGKTKNKELETPHRIAETVREQSLGSETIREQSQSLGAMVEDKWKSTEDVDGTRQPQQEAEESSAKKVCSLEVDENGNNVKLLNCENCLVEKQCSKSSLTMVYNQGKSEITKFSTQKTSTVMSAPGAPVPSSQAPDALQHPLSIVLQTSPANGLIKGLQSSNPSALVPSSINEMIAPRSSFSSPNVFPFTPLSDSHLCLRRPHTGNFQWAVKSFGYAVTVYEWLRSLRLHKYSEVFRGKTFEEMLKLSDKDFEDLHLTAGARRRLRVNLEVLRKWGCFTSDGLYVVGILPSLSSDVISLQRHNSALPNGLFGRTNLPYNFGPPHFGYNSDSEFLHGLSESDSASDCSSDVMSEPGTQTSFSIDEARKCPVLNGGHLSCYNCGSLGHVGGQCMAPNLDNRPSYGYHFKYDALQECG